MTATSSSSWSTSPARPCGTDRRLGAVRTAWRSRCWPGGLALTRSTRGVSSPRRQAREHPARPGGGDQPPTWGSPWQPTGRRSCATAWCSGRSATWRRSSSREPGRLRRSRHLRAGGRRLRDAQPRRRPSPRRIRWPWLARSPPTAPRSVRGRPHAPHAAAEVLRRTDPDREDARGAPPTSSTACGGARARARTSPSLHRSRRRSPRRRAAVPGPVDRPVAPAPRAVGAAGGHRRRPRSQPPAAPSPVAGCRPERSGRPRSGGRSPALSRATPRTGRADPCRPGRVRGPRRRAGRADSGGGRDGPSGRPRGGSQAGTKHREGDGPMTTTGGSAAVATTAAASGVVANPGVSTPSGAVPTFHGLLRPPTTSRGPGPSPTRPSPPASGYASFAAGQSRSGGSPSTRTGRSRGAPVGHRRGADVFGPRV